MKILVTEKVSEQGIELLRQQHEVDIIEGLSHEELLAIIPNYHALIVRSETQVTKQVIEAAVNLKVIGRAGVGLDNIDIHAATAKGITVLNTREGNVTAASEHTLALMFALARHVPQAHLALKSGQWERERYVGVEICGKTLGILGFGRIGSAVAEKALALGMKVIVYDPFIREEKPKEMGAELLDLDEVFARSDFLTLHLPLTAETWHMLNAEAFRKMKPGIRIIQCSRGGIIDENALVDAIKAGIVAGAALDVFEQEPPDTDHPLFSLDEVIYTPHLRSYTKEAQIGVAVDVAEGVLTALRGEPVVSAVNMPHVAKGSLDVIRPYLTLAEKMGSLAVQLVSGRIDSVEMIYNGSISEVDTKMITTAAVMGILNPILQDAVNYVNATTVAKARGIKIREIKSKDTESFADLVSVQIRTDKEELRVAGTQFGREEGRIVMINGYRVDVEPQGWLLIAPHYDHPGMVGKVGSILGEYQINIRTMQVSSTKQEGTNVMVVGVQSDIPQEVLRRINEIDGIIETKVVNFGE